MLTDVSSVSPSSEQNYLVILVGYLKYNIISPLFADYQNRSFPEPLASLSLSMKALGTRLRGLSYFVNVARSSHPAVSEEDDKQDGGKADLYIIS